MIRRIAGVLAVIVLCVMTLFAGSAMAATITWVLPTEYVDATPIPTADQARIISNLYYGSSSTGPWTYISSTVAGATTGTGPDPARGATRWYTVDCTLDGMTGPKGVAASKTMPFQTPKAPASITVN